MIEISFGKLVLLALIALIVLGPEKLPGAARTAGALLRRVRSGWDSVRSEVERELQVEEIKRQAREAAARAEAAQADLDATLRKVREASAQRMDAPAVEPAQAPASETPSHLPDLPASAPDDSVALDAAASVSHAAALEPATTKDAPHGGA